MVVDEAECELAIIDLIQVFVRVLNSCFENVCELDVIFNFDLVSQCRLWIDVHGGIPLG